MSISRAEAVVLLAACKPLAEQLTNAQLPYLVPILQDEADILSGFLEVVEAGYAYNHWVIRHSGLTYMEVTNLKLRLAYHLRRSEAD